MKEEKSLSKINGTLAIDLGNSTTVVAFQAENDRSVQLIEINPISRSKGEIPTLVWKSPKRADHFLFGQEVENLNPEERQPPSLSSDFKRWIGASEEKSKALKSFLLPEEAGELFIQKIWSAIPKKYNIKRLILTAPVETYKAYRTWLYKVCSNLEVQEIALVDEPTAAAIGSHQKGGSKLLVIDIGGSTIDMSMVLLEGGEGQAEPIAQLMRFNGQDLEGKSQQVLRCAKVLGKQGLRLGGRDIDRWIANHLIPNSQNNELILNAVEKLKCKLSDISISETQILSEELITDSLSGDTELLRLSRIELEELLMKNGLIKSLQKLFEQTLSRGRSNGCDLEDLTGVILVGGGSRIPLIKEWLNKQLKSSILLTPPPIEAVVLGALRLTPGVEIKDVLSKGVAIRCWDQKTNKHIWHPIFLPGQTWPTEKPMSIILAASKENQVEFDLKIADYDLDGSHEIIYVSGIPTIKDDSPKAKFLEWNSKAHRIQLNPPGKLGKDSVKVNFHIDKSCNLIFESVDLRNNKKIANANLGVIR